MKLSNVVLLSAVLDAWDEFCGGAERGHSSLEQSRWLPANGSVQRATAITMRITSEVSRTGSTLGGLTPTVTRGPTWVRTRTTRTRTTRYTATGSRRAIAKPTARIRGHNGIRQQRPLPTAHGATSIPTMRSAINNNGCYDGIHLWTSGTAHDHDRRRGLHIVTIARTRDQADR